MTSLEILENSFGGSIPLTIKLESPPQLTVRILEDSFIQKPIRFLSSLKYIKKTYSYLLELAMQAEELERFQKELSGTKYLYVISFLVKMVFHFTFPIIFIKHFTKTWLTPSDFDILGYVSPVMKNNIYLKSKNIQRDSKAVEEVISHENIHVLQSSHGEFDFDKRRIENERVDDFYEQHVNGNVKREKYFKYLFNRLEVEARIHELVSAFYTTTHQIPLSRKEFLVCLLYSNGLLDRLDSNLEIFSLKAQLQRCRSTPKDILDLLDEIKKHAIVMSIPFPISIPTKVTSEFFLLLNAINGPNELFNFISFELPTYYCNVLKLYGSESASSNLQNEIDKERELHNLKSTRKDAS